MDRFSTLLQQDSVVRQKRQEALYKAHASANEWVAAGLRELSDESLKTRGLVSFQTFKNFQGATDEDVLLRGRVGHEETAGPHFTLEIRWMKARPQIVTVTAGATKNEVPLNELEGTTPLNEILKAFETELQSRQGSATS